MPFHVVTGVPRFASFFRVDKKYRQQAFKIPIQFLTLGPRMIMGNAGEWKSVRLPVYLLLLIVTDDGDKFLRVGKLAP